MNFGISIDLRKIRVSKGYGIEKELSDRETKKIIYEIVIPEFKKGNNQTLHIRKYFIIYLLSNRLCGGHVYTVFYYPVLHSRLILLEMNTLVRTIQNGFL